jgi:hypothetical protein
MSGKTRKQKRAIGDIVTVNLGDGFHTYARTLEEGMFVFYDCRVKEELPIDQGISCPILFQVPVMDYAVTRGHWKVVGTAPLDDALKNPPPRFMQDALRPNMFSIYEKGKIRPAAKEECIGLERAAVWDPDHVEDRLRDHYAGRKNKWVESMRMKE